MTREAARARRDAENDAAISAHAKKVAAELGPLTSEDIAVLRDVFADVTPVQAPARPATRRERAS